ncbi:MAG TPA: hypothetical protein VGL51_00890 [Solirubrobacteraceae bacterium]|jgi:hypothetical protein
MRRRNVLLLILAGVIVFLVISVLLTRALSVGGAEDAAITSLVRSEARGDTSQLIAAISGCRDEPACRARVAANVSALKRQGGVSIIQIQESAGFSLTATLGTARVAWLVGSSLPIVQCVRVRHAGDVLGGFRIELLAVSRRIKSDAACPAHF